jgi:phosphoesterase RecJ-like protein
MEYGVNMPELYMRSLVQRSFEAVRYWSAGLSTMEKENGMVWATLTQADRQAAGYPGRDDADLINILSSIGEADVTMIFVEQPGEGVKVSWRARPGGDVSQVALRFGGGGHPAAAGAEIPGTLEEVRQMVLQETRLLLAELPASQPA